MKEKEKIFIGGAWPYANGSLHLGHISALLGGDILARYYRLKGLDVLFVSGSDCHGTPITIAAEKLGKKPVEIAEKYDAEFRRDLIDNLGFTYDVFSKTIDEDHTKLVQEIFLDLLDKGFLYKKTQELPFCKSCNRFLPDRYVEGACPRCGFENARGDQCDNCGFLVDVKELINPICKICGGTPIWRESEHFFLKLSAFEGKLKNWIKSQSNWRPNVYQFSLAILEKGLKDRAVTRDVDWGVEIPIKGYENKRIYVWFEAVCGYLSASKKKFKKDKNQDRWEDFWKKKCRHYYVFGKDNIIFHSIIWPSILMGVGGLNLPTDPIASEYLNLEGKQFSTSRKWAVWVPDFLDKYDPDALRYYLTINGPETTDVNFTWESFVTRNNAELVGNFGNFIHRVMDFVYKKFEGKIPVAKDLDNKDKDFINLCKSVYDVAGKEIENGNFKQALKNVFSIAEEGNRYLDYKAPWRVIKTDRATAGTALNLCILAIFNLRNLISPFLPFSSEKIEGLFSGEKLNRVWNFEELPKRIKINSPTAVYQRLDEKIITEELEKLGAVLAKNNL